MPRNASLSPQRDPKSGRFYISVPPKMSETGKRRRLFFDSESKAKAEAKRRMDNLKRHGYVSASLPADVATEAARCLEMLRPWGVSFTEAVSAYVEIREQQAQSVTVSEAWDAFLREKDGMSERYKRDLRYIRSKTPESLSDRLICNLDREAVKGACNANGTTPTAFTDARKIWFGLFQFAIREGWARENPVKRIPVPKKPVGEPCILSLDQAAAMLRNAEVCEQSAVALLLFAGVRPDELKRLDWDDVNLSSRYLRIPAAKSKTATARNVYLESVAVEWLKRERERTGPIVPANWKRRISRIRKAAGLTAEDQDICRHSYGSMWLAANNGDSATLQSYMGHAHVSTYLRHYHNAVELRLAIRYWKLTPEFVLRNVKAGGAKETREAA